MLGLVSKNEHESGLDDGVAVISANFALVTDQEIVFLILELAPPL